MIILGIESASKVASIAVARDGEILSCRTISDTRTHSETLMPLLDEVLKEENLSMEEIDAIAVSAGPGSFTGLRIGAAMAKGLALIRDIPVIPVPTIDALAYGASEKYGEEFIVLPILDARRGEVYTGLYGKTGNEETEILIPQTACPLKEIAEKAGSYADGKKILVIGDGLLTLQDKVKEFLPDAVLAKEEEIRLGSAKNIALLGYRKYLEGKVSDAVSFVPTYLRMSQAERERLDAGLSITPEGNAETKESGIAGPLKEECFLRLFDEKDFEKISAMEREVFPGDAWSGESIAYWIDKGLIYGTKDEIVGYIFFQCMGEEIELQNIAVSAKYQGQGYGTDLLKKALLGLSDGTKKTVFLEVRENNERAKKLYEKNGFVAYRTRTNYYRNPIENAILYRLDMNKD